MPGPGARGLDRATPWALLTAGDKEGKVSVSHQVGKSAESGLQEGGGNHFVQDHHGSERRLASWTPTLAWQSQQPPQELRYALPPLPE